MVEEVKSLKELEPGKCYTNMGRFLHCSFSRVVFLAVKRKVKSPVRINQQNYRFTCNSMSQTFCFCGPLAKSHKFCRRPLQNAFSSQFANSQ